MNSMKLGGGTDIMAPGRDTMTKRPRVGPGYCSSMIAAKPLGFCSPTGPTGGSTTSLWWAPNTGDGGWLTWPLVNDDQIWLLETCWLLLVVNPRTNPQPGLLESQDSWHFLQTSELAPEKLLMALKQITSWDMAQQPEVDHPAACLAYQNPRLPVTICCNQPQTTSW